MRRTRWLLTAALAAAAAAPAGSIWDKGHRRTHSIVADDTARDVGDTLTIRIEESSKIANSTERGLSKDSSREAKMDGTLDLQDVIPGANGKIFEFPDLDFTASAKPEFDGEADFDSSRSVRDEISVVVEDVLPNGNMVVLGRRTREVAGDSQVIQVSGIVRPSDVTFDNTVRSKRVAEFHIVYEQHGQENGFFNPGWLARLLNLLNPF